MGCSWDEDKGWGGAQTYSQGIRRPHYTVGSVLVWSWKRIQEEWLVEPKVTLKGKE
jgi:hypothetical protein